MARSVSRQRVIVRQSYYWPDQQLNFWIIIMLATGGVLIGVFANFVVVQNTLGGLGIPWIMPFGISVGSLTVLFIWLMLVLIWQRRLLPGVVMLGSFILLVLYITGVIATAIQLFGPEGNINGNCQTYVFNNKQNQLNVNTLAWLQQQSICQQWQAVFAFWIVGAVFLVWMLVLGGMVARGGQGQGFVVQVRDFALKTALSFWALPARVTLHSSFISSPLTVHLHHHLPPSRAPMHVTIGSNGRIKHHLSAQPNPLYRDPLSYHPLPLLPFLALHHLNNKQQQQLHQPPGGKGAMEDITIGSPGHNIKAEIKAESEDELHSKPIAEVISLPSDDEEDAAIPARLPEVNLGTSMLNKENFDGKKSKTMQPTLFHSMKERIKETQRMFAHQMRDPETPSQPQSPPISNSLMPAFATSDNSGLFISENESGADGSSSPPPAEESSRKRKRATTTQTRRKKAHIDNDDYDDYSVDILERYRGDQGGKKKSGGGRKRQPKPKYKGPVMLNPKNINNVNVIEDAAQNEGLADPPTFDESSRRKDALDQLIQSIPVENRAIAQADIRFFNDRLKKFTGSGHSVKAAAGGNFTVKGMRISLKPYQILGVAYMRERETSSQLPRGGLLCDQMGLGKTIMVLANIVNGRPLQKKNRQTTLIVASAALIAQWNSEIATKLYTRYEDKIHGIGRVVQYHSGAKIKSNEDVQMLQEAEVVLTTYHAVSKSYPQAEIPVELTTAAQKEAWWADYFCKHRGPLHRVKFHRVVLDEAQAIKNHKSLTSRACRALDTTHPWSISGTIVLNSVSEFYPQFRFLKVAHTETFRKFKAEYTSLDDPEGMDRLTTRLGHFMIRRTHQDRLFESKLLSLPTPHQEINRVSFNEIERTIYEIVKKRFIERINNISRANEIDKQYNFIWSMLLRLRQLTAHVFLVQDTLTDLLQRDDFERLRTISAGDLSEESKALLGYLQQHMTSDTGKKHRNSTDETTVLTESEIAPIDQTEFDGSRADLGGKHGITFHFQRYLTELLQSETFQSVCERTFCVACRQPPHEPLVTSCFHIYCRQCLEDTQASAARLGSDRHHCTECRVIYTDAKPCEKAIEPFSTGHEASSSLEAGFGSKSKGKKPEDTKWFNLPGDILPSAKTLAFKARVMTWLNKDPDAKIVCYSQFIPLIHILWRICKTEGWSCERYTGTMSHDARQHALERFSDRKGGVKILLASLKAGGIGLNLTAANKVITIDPWWNASIEQQAFCRVYRIGQEKETQMARLVVRNSIDEAIVALQDSKQIDIDAAMDESRRKEKLSNEELMGLFGTVTKDDQGRPFVHAHQPHDDDEREGYRPQPAPDHSSDEEGDGIVDDD
ncbi:hypothetical protein Q7P37_007444 [Cladosporium fusiforme]